MKTLFVVAALTALTVISVAYQLRADAAHADDVTQIRGTLAAPLIGFGPDGKTVNIPAGQRVTINLD
jgi:hypothetical protein